MNLKHIAIEAPYVSKINKDNYYFPLSQLKEIINRAI
jgi:hypothetical protein